ncbi:MAG TPA: glucokinase [Vicinamibacterales bacterium]|jgi:glucokinase|nr:glucokinase [Vicinamibacterales bacterium]
MLLAGDVGGTSTRLGLFARAPERPTPVRTAEFITLDYESIEQMLAAFLADSGAGGRVEAIGLGVAGVVTRHIARLTNVPWVVDARAIADRFRIRHLSLLNDLEAMAHAVPVLEPDELAVLQEGAAAPDGNAAVIAAGTGLGEALLHNIDGRFVPSPTEGGHTDFAPRTPREVEFFQDLVRIYGRAEYEQVISGQGIVNLTRFTHASRPCPASSIQDPIAIPAAVTESALAKRCCQCMEVLDIFVSAYGAEAGNLALRSLATGGLYVGGGIALKIMPALEDGRFLDALRSKGPMTDLMATIPVYVILHPHPGLLGAAVRANQSD